ncbi:hypothetical protein ACJ73_01118 [Blastomyces percursus]|uniref:Uncharacterized protein n=1 Tax=Blastomyces percursus TaxID=1658174 RepID=A0A1J9RFX2_9EURO|nr:hypothetical protein ACJ73_01118 [Blastomyces percursus]
MNPYKRNSGKPVGGRKTTIAKVTPHSSKPGKGAPFFEKMSAQGLTGEILGASWLDAGLAKPSRRSGYDKVIAVHDMRTEALVRANGKQFHRLRPNTLCALIALLLMAVENGYSIEELMQFADHGGNPRIYFESYMSSTSTVAGVSNMFGLGPRPDLAETFRGFTLRRHPRLWQTLPARLSQDLEDSEECRKELYKHKERLLARELDSWQMRLPRERKPGATEEDDYTLSYHWTWFYRAAHLTPERKRLSSLLFLSVPLRSPEGRQALEDMVTICKQKSPVS